MANPNKTTDTVETLSAKCNELDGMLTTAKEKIADLEEKQTALETTVNEMAKEIKLNRNRIDANNAGAGNKVSFEENTLTASKIGGKTFTASNKKTYGVSNENQRFVYHPVSGQKYNWNTVMQNAQEGVYKELVDLLIENDSPLIYEVGKKEVTAK